MIRSSVSPKKTDLSKAKETSRCLSRINCPYSIRDFASRKFFYKHEKVKNQLLKLGLNIKNIESISGEYGIGSHYEVKVILDNCEPNEIILKFEQKWSRSNNMVLTEESLIKLLTLWVYSKENKSEQELQEIARLSIDTRPLEKQFIEEVFDFWCDSKQKNRITEVEWSDIKNQMYLLISKGFKQKPLHEIFMQIFQRDLFILDVENNSPVFNHAHPRYDQNYFIYDFLRSMNTDKTLILDIDRTLKPDREDLETIEALKQKLDLSKIKNDKIPFYSWVDQLNDAILPQLFDLGFKKANLFTAGSEATHEPTHQEFVSKAKANHKPTYYCSAIQNFISKVKAKMKKHSVPSDKFQFELYSQRHTYEIYKLKKAIGKTAITVATTSSDDRTVTTTSYDGNAELNSDGTVNIEKSNPMGVTVATRSNDRRTVTTTSYDGNAELNSDGTVNIKESKPTGITVERTSSDGKTITSDGKTITTTTYDKIVMTTSYDGSVNIDASTGLPDTSDEKKVTEKTRSIITVRESFDGLKTTTINTYNIVPKEPTLIRKTVSQKLDNGYLKEKTYNIEYKKVSSVDITVKKEKELTNPCQKMTLYHYIRPIKFIIAPGGSIVIDDLLDNILIVNEGIILIQSGNYNKDGTFILDDEEQIRRIKSELDELGAALTNKDCTSLGTTNPGSSYETTPASDTFLKSLYISV